jgi:hypothetical protein
MAFPDDADDQLFSDAPKSFGLLERWGKTVGRSVKVVAKISDPSVVDQLQLGQGNHNLYVNAVMVPKNKDCDALRYIHVPVRSPEQAFRKFVCGWFSNVQKFGKDTAMATHWKNAFNLICEEDGYANRELAFMLNNLYTGPVDIENDFEKVDAKSIFKYELTYGDLRKKGFSVVLRNIESDFDVMHKKLPKS